MAPHSFAVYHLMALPSIDNVSTDGFMKQLGHASLIIPLLHQEDSETSDEEKSALSEVLCRQLSHSEGVRGFFAVYLTSPESLTVDNVPVVLAEAVKNADKKVMVPLACMNVIMPTAMSSIHQDVELRECASKTAVNGIKILRLLKGSDDVSMNCKAIMSVCRGTGDGSEDLIEFWNRFFVSYGYADEQKEDIALVMSEFC
ncbi:hypothetical protein ACHAW5_007725 [Stephanodiscus triporus]|uniref:Uncharacterized protein n=1 Tax=Stephanodiscus triporus TaxID=2934178 RepID=A0ABD3PPM7_9STRA